MTCLLCTTARAAGVGVVATHAPSPSGRTAPRARTLRCASARARPIRFGQPKRTAWICAQMGTLSAQMGTLSAQMGTLSRMAQERGPPTATRAASHGPAPQPPGLPGDRPRWRAVDWSCRPPREKHTFNDDDQDPIQVRCGEGGQGETSGSSANSRKSAAAHVSATCRGEG